MTASAKSEPSTPRAISDASRLAARAAAVSFARQSASACCRISRILVAGIGVAEADRPDRLAEVRRRLLVGEPSERLLTGRARVRGGLGATVEARARGEMVRELGKPPRALRRPEGLELLADVSVQSHALSHREITVDRLADSACAKRHASVAASPATRSPSRAASSSASSASCGAQPGRRPPAASPRTRAPAPSATSEDESATLRERPETVADHVARVVGDAESDPMKPRALPPACARAPRRRRDCRPRPGGRSRPRRRAGRGPRAPPEAARRRLPRARRRRCAPRHARAPAASRRPLPAASRRRGRCRGRAGVRRRARWRRSAAGATTPHRPSGDRRARRAAGCRHRAVRRAPATVSKSWNRA